jgi:dimethylaniline monooxygenase (N-oxide forming)
MVWSGIRDLPDDATLRAGVAEWRQQKRITHELMLNNLAVMLAEDAGVAPRLDARPEIARALLFGPLAPAQFRLDGHGSQPEALPRFVEAIGSFNGDTSPVPTPEQLALVGVAAGALGDRLPDLARAHDLLRSMSDPVNRT